ncbi:hypothetical protein ABE957_04440 [Halomonas sp. CS7]|uniref:Uncharacterized protein n=1 Tax=Halomonas pelophila TaxID=3151122 RepID=A0ABV1N2H7_9GAMM
MNDQVDVEKKRLMFISGEDFYFLAYSIFVILECLGSKNGTYFKDHRKLAFLVPVLSNEDLVGIFQRNKGKVIANGLDKDLVKDLYHEGVSSQGEITKLLMMLEKKDYLILRKGSESEAIDVSLSKKVFGKGLIEKRFFNKEFRNCAEIKRLFPRLSVLRLDTLLEGMFEERGIARWGF